MAKNLSSLIQRNLQGKTILLTGGTGSFGQRLTKILVEHFSFKAL